MKKNGRTGFGEGCFLTLGRMILIRLWISTVESGYVLPFVPAAVNNWWKMSFNFKYLTLFLLFSTVLYRFRQKSFSYVP